MTLQAAADKVLIFVLLMGITYITAGTGCTLLRFILTQFDNLLQYGVKIFVMTSFKDTCYIEIQPKVQKSNKGIRITHFLYSSKWVGFDTLTLHSAIFFSSGFSGAVELLGGGSLQLDIFTER